MGSFRYFKYASKTREDEIMIEEDLVEKMAKWQYDSSELKSRVTENLLVAVTIHWDNATKLEKEIREQTLRQVMPKHIDKEVKYALKYHEARHAPRFKTIQILGKKIKNVVQNSTKSWEIIFKVKNLVTKEEEKVEEKEEEENDEEEEKEEEEDMKATAH